MTGRFGLAVQGQRRPEGTTHSRGTCGLPHQTKRAILCRIHNQLDPSENTVKYILNVSAEHPGEICLSRSLSPSDVPHWVIRDILNKSAALYKTPVIGRLRGTQAERVWGKLFLICWIIVRTRWNVPKWGTLLLLLYPRKHFNAWVWSPLFLMVGIGWWRLLTNYGYYWIIKQLE